MWGLAVPGGTPPPTASAPPEWTRRSYSPAGGAVRGVGGCPSRRAAGHRAPPRPEAGGNTASNQTPPPSVWTEKGKSIPKRTCHRISQFCDRSFLNHFDTVRTTDYLLLNWRGRRAALRPYFRALKTRNPLYRKC